MAIKNLTLLRAWSHHRATSNRIWKTMQWLHNVSNVEESVTKRSEKLKSIHWTYCQVQVKSITCPTAHLQNLVLIRYNRSRTTSDKREQNESHTSQRTTTKGYQVPRLMFTSLNNRRRFERNCNLPSLELPNRRKQKTRSSPAQPEKLRDSAFVLSNS